jgi:hypothetical protein
MSRYYLNRHQLCCRPAERAFAVERLRYIQASRAAHRREACVAENERFQGFFSYTHLDAEIDPDLVEALSPPPPPAITVCINPQDGRTGISALPLPPAEHENHLSKPLLPLPTSKSAT